jgi:DNA-binding SARP family transcriptional activator
LIDISATHEPSPSMQMTLPEQHRRPGPPADAPSQPIQICLLGNFRLLQDGQPVALQAGGKGETLLCHLGLHADRPFPRAALVHLLWPASNGVQANQSLNSLVYSLHKLVGAALGGAAPVLHAEGYYRLNVETGVGVDVASFDAWADAGDQQVRAGDRVCAANSYRQSIDLYRGDLCIATEVENILERERLRSRFLSLLAYLADAHYQAGEYGACLDQAWRLLGHDSCREDAHRAVMRCYVRRGERAAALRHYHVCEHILHIAFDAAPELATTALYDQIRLRPSHV